MEDRRSEQAQLKEAAKTHARLEAEKFDWTSDDATQIVGSPKKESYGDSFAAFLLLA